MLAIIWTTKHFSPYLYGQTFKIVTDHRPLTCVMNFKEPNSKLVRWKLQLQQFNWGCLQKGSQNVVADALARTTGDVTINCAMSCTDKDYSNAVTISTKPIQAERSTPKPFKNKIRTILETHNDEEKVNNILKQILKPNKTCAIFVMITSSVKHSSTTDSHKKLSIH